MATLLKVHKPDNFESHNSLKLNITSIWGPRSNFAGFRSIVETNFPDSLALYKT